MAASGTVKYRANPRFAAEIRASPELRAAIDQVCHQVAGFVRAFAPLGHDERHYRDSITVLARTTAPPVVATSSWRWHWIEYGSVHNHPSAPFRRGVEAAGLRWSDPGAHGGDDAGAAAEPSE